MQDIEKLFFQYRLDILNKNAKSRLESEKLCAYNDLIFDTNTIACDYCIFKDCALFNSDSSLCGRYMNLCVA